MSTRIEPTITLTDDGDHWVARDTETGVTSQGLTREAALDNLDEALAGYRGEGDPPSEEDLRDLGIDPANNDSGSLDDSDVSSDFGRAKYLTRELSPSCSTTNWIRRCSGISQSRLMRRNLMATQINFKRNFRQAGARKPS